jgi:single-strand DNA-binding protein
MAGLNRVTIIGNLGKDPEVRYTQSGTAVCNMRMGVTERRKEGETWQDHTEWFTVICFGKTAENAGRFLKKGRQVFVEGRLQTRQWQDKENQTRYTTEVVANQILFLGGKDAGMESGGFSAGSGSGASSGASSSPGAFASGSPSEFDPSSFAQEEDIPF